MIAADFNRIAPHDLDAERCTLSAALLDRCVFTDLRVILDAEDFFQIDHQIVWKIMCEMSDAQQHLDVISLRAELVRRNVYAQIGGADALVAMIEAMPGASNGPHYAKIVRDRSLSRQIIATCQRFSTEGYESPLPPADLLGSLSEQIAKIGVRNNAADYVTLDAAIDATWTALADGGISLVPTGIESLDSLVGGFAQGEICFLAARPSMGKSTISRQIAKSVARTGVGVGYISLEESPDKIVRNLLASESSIDNRRIRTANFGLEEWDALGAAKQAITGLPIYISYRARHINDIRNLVRLWRSKYDIRLLVIDHIGLVRVDGATPYERTSNASLEITSLVKETQVAGLVLCQLNRAVTGRDDKRPTMADMRESGRLEEDADAVVMLHREDYYRLDDSSYTPTQVAELIIAKWRDSVRGKIVRIRSNLPYQRFEEMPHDIPDFN